MLVTGGGTRQHDWCRGAVNGGATLPRRQGQLEVLAIKAAQRRHRRRGVIAQPCAGAKIINRNIQSCSAELRALSLSLSTS